MIRQGQATRYQVYLSNTREAIKGFRRAGIKVSKQDSLGKHLTMLDSALLQNAVYHGETPESLAASIAGRTLLQERIWMQGQRTTLFLDTPALVDSLLKARFSFDDLPVPDAPFTFAIALPYGCSYQGIEQSPILVTVGACRELEQEQFTMASKIWGMRAQFADRKGNRLAVMVAQRAPTSPNPELGHAYLSSYYTAEGLEAVVRDGSADHEEIVTSAHDVLNLTPDEAEQKMLALSVRLALATWVYWSTCPENVCAGTPPANYQDGDAPLLGRFKTLQMTSPRKLEQEREVTEHHRRWHFRQLRDERYYQGEHANRPRGSRWVLIPDSFVNRKNVEDYTATMDPSP